MCADTTAVLSPRQPIEKLVTLLNTLDQWIDETPPVDQPSRFGNKAFRTWYAKVDQVGWRGAERERGGERFPWREGQK